MRGTVSRVGQYVYGDCPCGENNTLVYETTPDEPLVCASCYRRWAKDNPREEICDECGGGPAWRDPVTRKNEFFCATCHAKHGTVFQNRWANAPRVSEPLGVRDSVQCEAAGYGTECKGEKKWRGEFKKILCNKHAGKVSAGPEWHQ